MKMFLPAVLAMITLTACSGDPPTRSDPIDPSPPSVQVIAPIQTDPGNPILIEWISDAETCSAPWTSQKSPSGKETVRIEKSTWFPVECRKRGVIVRDSAYVSVSTPPKPARRIIVIVQYVASESLPYTPDTVTLTFRNEGLENRIRVLDTTSIEAPNSYDDTVSFSIPGNESYYPVVAQVPRQNFSIASSSSDTISVVRIPRKWVVERGTYRGTVVKTSIIAGFDTAPDGSSFLGRSSASLSILGGYNYHPYGLDSKLLPIRVAIDRTASPREPISAQDSIDLWNSIQKMEEKYGRDLFYPGEANLGVDANEFLVSINPDAKNPTGGALPSFTQRWESRGGVFVSSLVDRFHSEFVVEHEFMHGLGFGHHCKWVSIMVSNCPRGDEPVVYPSPEKDVAYFELRFAVNKVRRVHKALYHWGENQNGERLEQGLLPEPIFYGNPFTKEPRP